MPPVADFASVQNLLTEFLQSKNSQESLTLPSMAERRV
jgi:hypothetical protein